MLTVCSEGAAKGEQVRTEQGSDERGAGKGEQESGQQRRTATACMFFDINLINNRKSHSPTEEGREIDKQRETQREKEEGRDITLNYTPFGPTPRCPLAIRLPPLMVFKHCRNKVNAHSCCSCLLNVCKLHAARCTLSAGKSSIKNI